MVQVSCGSAHTLVLSSDGRVHAFGFNGQGAVGAGEDGQDALSPVVVPGLPPCSQVAAAAASMALGCDGRVYQWGAAASRLLGGSSSNGSCSSSSIGGGGSSTTAQASSPGAAAAKRPVPWLSHVEVVRLACGVENAAALTADGRLLLWGSSSSLPASMARQAVPLAAAAAAAASQPNDTSVEPALVSVQLTVTPQATVRLALACRSAGSSSGGGGGGGAVLPPGSFTRAAAAAAGGGSTTDSPGCGLDFAREPLQALACGEAHCVLLSQPSEHTPSAGEGTGCWFQCTACIHRRHALLLQRQPA